MVNQECERADIFLENHAEFIDDLVLIESEIL